MKNFVINSEDISDLCKKNDIAFLGLFGSYVHGDFTPESDVDLLVRFSKSKSLLDLVRIEREISERIGKPVDLLTEASLSPYLRDRILADLKGIYEQKR